MDQSLEQETRSGVRSIFGLTKCFTLATASLLVCSLTLSRKQHAGLLDWSVSEKSGLASELVC